LGWNGQRPFPQDSFDLADGNEEVSAVGICRRIQALKSALDHLDKQALRLARREARLNLASSPPHRRTIRMGQPPGYHRRPAHDIDDVLRECHSLALHVQKLDTS
jgi:hypothetical protein